MIQNKELPSEYVSIRTIWLQGINDCRKAIGERAIQEATEERIVQEIGDRTVCYSVQALVASLCDFGEATVKTDVDHYIITTYEPRVKTVWDLKNKDHNYKWQQHAKISVDLYAFVVQTLNRYGMLFEKQPEGYSNVEMRSEEVNNDKL